MPTTVQFRRGTDAQNDAFTGSAGEITYDTTNNTLRAHDGSTAGGSVLATESYVDTAVGGIEANAITSGTTSVSIASAGANVVANVAGANIITIHGDGIDNNLADGVGNIGNATTGFNTVFAKATSAQYADLAENYIADTDYEPGTVLVVGGDAEVTACSQYADSASAGVVSTNPAHLMNSGLDTPNTVALALAGRVPCKVVGTVTKGDLLTTSEKPGVATRLLPDSFVPGCVIGKALENYSSDAIGTIEVLVGKS